MSAAHLRQVGVVGVMALGGVVWMGEAAQAQTGAAVMSGFYMKSQTSGSVYCEAKGRGSTFRMVNQRHGTNPGWQRWSIPASTTHIDINCRAGTPQTPGASAPVYTVAVSTLNGRHVSSICSLQGASLQCNHELYVPNPASPGSGPSATSNTGPSSSPPANNPPANNPPATNPPPATNNAATVALTYYLLNELGHSIYCVATGLGSHASRPPNSPVFRETLRAPQSGRFEMRLAVPTYHTHLELRCTRNNGATVATFSVAINELSNKHLVSSCRPHPSVSTSFACTHQADAAPPPLIPSSSPPEDHSGAPDAQASQRKLRVKSDFGRAIQCQLFHTQGSGQTVVATLNVPAKSTRETNFVLPAVDQLQFHCRPTEGAGTNTWSNPKSRIENRSLGTRGVSGACYSGGTLSCNAIMHQF